MGQQVMREQHRLCTLEVGVTGEVDVARLLGAREQALLQRDHLAGDGSELAGDVEAEVGRDLVVAAPAGVELRTHVAGDLGGPPFDRGVDVLVTGCELERTGLELVLDLVQRAEQLVHLGSGEEATSAEAADVRSRPFEIVLGEPAVVVERRRVLHDHVRSTAAQAALPESHRSDRGGVSSPSARARTSDQVATPSPQSRTKPSASWCRKVSESS